MAGILRGESFSDHGTSSGCAVSLDAEPRFLIDGLAPLVFAVYMKGRTGPMRLFGQAAHNMHPGCGRFAGLLFGESIAPS